MAHPYQQQRVRTVWWEEDPRDAQSAAVGMLDQSLLPQQVVFLRLEHEQQVAEAIVTLKVRGAPAIGVTAALGMALALHRFARERGPRLTLEEAQEHLQLVADMLSHTRPTAINLFWAIERMLQCMHHYVKEGVPVLTLVQQVCAEARAIADEDYAACLRMGTYGADLISDGDILLTHCNAGALATAGIGSGLAPVYMAHKAGKRVHVFVDETRPVLQGARLTAWELQQEGIPLTLITDTMAGHFMRYGGIKAVFVGADRIAANGDVANKIGTYSLGILAQAHKIPLYVVAPCSTIDLKLSCGEDIPLEQRHPEEVATLYGMRIAPSGIEIANPAFDVTPHTYVTAIITDKGIARPPYDVTLREACSSGSS